MSARRPDDQRAGGRVPAAQHGSSRRLVVAAAIGVLVAVAMSALGAPDSSPALAAELAQVTDDATGGRTAVPGLGGGGEGEEPGAAGELPFTGLMLLPLVMLAVLLVFGGIAWRRRAREPRTSRPGVR